MYDIMFNISITAIAQGLLLGIVALGVVIAFRFVDFPDLTVDGSFVLGAAIAAKLIFSGMNPFLATFLAIPCGALAGLATGLLHVKLGVGRLLSGILMMTMLYSINLRIMGRSNIPLIDTPTVLSFAGRSHLLVIGFLSGVTILLLIALVFFLRSEMGTAIRAIGASEVMLSGLGFSTNLLKIICLSVTNMFAALGGSLYAQYQGYCDVTMGIGTILVALAAIVIGEAFVQPTTPSKALFTALLGAGLYQLIITVSIFMGLPPTDLKLVTGLLVVAVLILMRRNQDSSLDVIARKY